MYVYVCECVCVWRCVFSPLALCHSERDREKIQIQYLTVRIPDAMKAKEKITKPKFKPEKMAAATTTAIIIERENNEIGMTLEWQGNVIFTRGNFRTNE